MGLTTRLTAFTGLVVVCGYLVLAVSPATVSFLPTAGELATLLLLVAAVVAAEYRVIARGLAPLRELADVMRGVDDATDFVPALTGRRDEIGQVAQALRAMMHRIAEERRQVGRRALQAQEEERTRVARELHDEVGQDLTVLMLEAVSLSRTADSPTAEGLEHLVEQMRTVVDEVRSISARLRPGALEDLGLKGAVQALVNDFQRQGRIRIGQVWDAVPPLDAEQELVCYRVAQEALTNVVRHADATRADVSVVVAGDRLVLTVRDDGRGITATPRSGIEGMHERARLVHGRLEVSGGDGGTRVQLTIPVTARTHR